MQHMKVLDLKFVDSIATIGAEQWNRLAGIENPFTRYEFLPLTRPAGRHITWQSTVVLRVARLVN